MIIKGRFNFLAMGRKLLADPNLPNKLMNNESSKIKPCHYAYKGVSRIFLNGQMFCASDVDLGKKEIIIFISRTFIVINISPFYISYIQSHMYLYPFSSSFL